MAAIVEENRVIWGIGEKILGFLMIDIWCFPHCETMGALIIVSYLFCIVLAYVYDLRSPDEDLGSRVREFEAAPVASVHKNPECFWFLVLEEEVYLTFQVTCGV